MSLIEKTNDQNVFLRLAARPPAFRLLTNFSPLEFRNDLIPLIEETYFELRRRRSGKLSRLQAPKPLVTQTWAPMSKSERAAWEAELNRLRYHQAEAVALVEKARRAAEARQIKLREELRAFLQTLTEAERKALEAAENKYRDELPNVLLLYFFRRRFNLTFECLAQIFRFKHRSSAIRHFEQAHRLMDEVTRWKTLPRG